ncbi:MAG: hypothetical protein WCI12_09825 [Actinomycetes bacterium]
MNQLISWGIGATAAACVTVGAISASASVPASPTTNSGGTDHSVSAKIASLKDTKHRLDRQLADRAVAASSNGASLDASSAGTEKRGSSATPTIDASGAWTSDSSTTGSRVYQAARSTASPADVVTTPTTTETTPPTPPPTTVPQEQWSDDHQSADDDQSEQEQGDD